jgi:hypothetical protein
LLGRDVKVDLRVLPDESNNNAGRRKTSSPDHQAAMERFGQSFELLLHDISDDELNSLIAKVERTGGWPATGAIW